MPNKITTGNPVKSNVRCHVLRSPAEFVKDTDGSVIGTIGTGNTTFIDNAPLNGDNWYRLRMEHLETGKVVYSLPMKSVSETSRGPGSDNGALSSVRLATNFGRVDLTNIPIGRRLYCTPAFTQANDTLTHAYKYIDNGKIIYTGLGVRRSWTFLSNDIAAPEANKKLIDSIFTNGNEEFHPELNIPTIDYVEEVKGVKYRIRAPRGFGPDWDGKYELGKINKHVLDSELVRYYDVVPDGLVKMRMNYETGENEVIQLAAAPLNNPWYIIAEKINNEYMAINGYGQIAKVFELPSGSIINYYSLVEVIG